MKTHKNSPFTPKGRLQLVRAVHDDEVTVASSPNNGSGAHKKASGNDGDDQMRPLSGDVDGEVEWVL